MKGTNYLHNMFGSSPIRPLQQHMSKVQACVSALPAFFEAVIEDDWDKAVEKQREISKMEGAADDLKKDLRLNLPKGLFLPVSRRDLLEILTMQDRIANKT